MKTLKLIITIFIITLFLNKCTNAQNIINTSNYSIVESNKNIFSNAYSSITISIKSLNNSENALYIKLDENITNDTHIQSIFEAIKKDENDYFVFDIYFPLLLGMDELKIKIYTQGTDPTAINNDTPYIPYTVNFPDKKSGSALMLYQENKERNVRVFQTTDSIPGSPADNQSVEYFWIGRNLDNPSEVVQDAIAHITEEKNTFLLNSLNLKEKTGETFSGIRIFNDPVNNNKTHIYLHTDSTGVATLKVAPTTKTAGGHLIYWPFANNTSEAARVVVYNPNILAEGFREPIIRKNPVTISKDNACDTPTFDITTQNPQNIAEGGRLYLLINNSYDNSIITPDRQTITMTASNRFINTSTLDLPQPNDARYIYVAQDGTVSTSGKYSFFAYAGIADQVTRPDGSIVTFCKTQQITNYTFNAALSPSNEVPPVIHPTASGNLAAQYSTETKILQWNITYTGGTDASGKPANILAAHFHGPASPSQNAGIIINIPADALQSPIIGQQTLTQEQENQLTRGLWYFNIHTQDNPGGFLRGQLNPS